MNGHVDWLNAQNVVAILAAVLGVVASFAGVWYERRVLRRRRIGYRVQMDMPIGRDNRHGRGRADIRLGLFSDLPDMSDATLVLLRIANDGAQSIADTDYTRRALHGLAAVFTERIVRGVAVTEPEDEHLLDHFTPSNGMAHDGDTVHLPRVPLNRGQHYKLLVLLSGGSGGSEVRVTGGIRDGVVARNRSTTVDDKSPLFSRFSRAIIIGLTLGIVALAVIIVSGQDAVPAPVAIRPPTPPPLGCATGRLTVNGSTAFAPVVQEVARRYQTDCRGSTVTVAAQGSNKGVQDLTKAGAAAASGSPTVLTVYDGQPESRAHLSGLSVALSTFAVVVNNQVPLPGLTSTSIRSIYRGDIANWNQLGGPDLPIRLVSRGADSGTRDVFRSRILDGVGEPALTSQDCLHTSSPRDRVIRCERDDTEGVLSTVATVPGAIGYGELEAAGAVHGLHTLALDGRAPVDGATAGSPLYPFVEIEHAYTYGESRPRAPSSPASATIWPGAAVRT